MSRGRRYDSEPKLNMKKVFAVFIAFVVIIMFVFVLKGILSRSDETGKIVSNSYFTAFQDEKWGVINQLGEFVIDPSYQEMIVIPNSKADVFLCTYDVNYETGTYKTKALNSKNKEIFTEYEQIEAISNKDEANNLWYDQNVVRVMKDQKYGLINLSGKEVLALEYEEIVPIQGIENAFKVKKDGKYGIANTEGKIVLDIKYADVTTLGKDNKSGYIVKTDDGKYGIVDYSNSIVLEAKYDAVSNVYGNDSYVVTEAGKVKLVGKDGTEKLSEGFDDIKQVLKSQDNGVIFTKGGKYGVMKLNGEETIAPEYENLVEAKSGFLIAKKDGKYGVIDIAKTEKLAFNYENINYYETADIYVAEDEQFQAEFLNSNFESKLSGILVEFNLEKGFIKLKGEDSYKYYNLKFEEKSDTEVLTDRTLFARKKDGKFGFVDKTGKVVVDYQYDDVTEQNVYGFAGVKKDGKWGSIDQKGAVVQEPVYNLDDYLYVDFIGRWHLGYDLNMNYYNKE